ncbi:hypothetical protein ACQX19_05955 [Corynebacterium diphtheriae]
MLEHKIWHREGFWLVVSDFVGFFADVDVRAFEENRVQVGLSFVKEDHIGDVGSNVGGALVGESQPSEKDGFLLCRAVLDVLVPVIVELLYSVDLLVFVGKFEEVVRKTEEDDVFKDFQDFTDDDVAVLERVLVRDLPLPFDVERPLLQAVPEVTVHDGTASVTFHPLCKQYGVPAQHRELVAVPICFPSVSGS